MNDKKNELATPSINNPSCDDKGEGLCVAIIGAGPAGLYATQLLLEAVSNLRVDVFDRLPTPYGLVRYGIAPDNQQMKSVTRALKSAFDDAERVRFFGNVHFGKDIYRADLLEHYDAIIYATGAQGERRLGIPGEDLTGCYSAKKFVNWYNGHPDAAGLNFTLQEKQVAVIGAGNVALDMARILLRSPDDLAITDVPDRVLKGLSNSRVTDVYVIARRGPAQAKFTPMELRAIKKLSNIDVIVRPEELQLSKDDEALIESDRQLQTNISILREWSHKSSTGKARRIHFRFRHRPVQVLGTDFVNGILLERGKIGTDTRMCGEDEMERLPVGMIFHAIGYNCEPLLGVPFDPKNSTLSNHGGRIVDEKNNLSEREYVCGWAKRGPSGTVGNNKSDAAETVCGLIQSLASKRQTREHKADHIVELLYSRNVDHTNWANWLRLDEHEIQLGRKQDRPRVKVYDLRTMLNISRRLA